MIKKGIVLLISIIIGFVMGADIVKKKMLNKCDDIETISSKHLELFIMMNQWIKVKQEGKSLANYLEEKGYFNIAIYGMSYAGKTLMEELKNSQIKICYGIDKNINLNCPGINIFSMEDKLENVDVVIVTSITFFDEIQENLSKKINCSIVSLEDILYEI